MTEWENKIFQAQTAEELNEIKLRLSREAACLENERKKLKRDRFLVEQQLCVLQDGFKKLDADRQSFESEKQKFIRERLAQGSREKEVSLYPSKQAAEILFRNTDNPLALQKRYRDLVKIFHPDNLFGDAELAQQINREYARRKLHGG